MRKQHEIPPPPPAPAQQTNVAVSFEPPAAKVGRAIVDAVGDVVINLFVLGIIAYAWLARGALDKVEAAAAGGVVLGYWSVASVIDRFTAKRVSRSPLTMLIGVLAGSGKGGAAAAAAAEVARRTIIVLPLAFLLASCGWWNSTGKPIARTLNDIARDYCEASMVKEAERQQLSAKELCLLPYIFEPFLQAPGLATDAARAQEGAP